MPRRFGVCSKSEAADREQRRQKMEQLRAEGDKQAMAVLKPDQKKKLVEMLGEPFTLDRSQFGSRRGGQSRPE